MNQYCSLSAFLENIGVLCTLRAPGVPLAALTNGDRGISRFAEGRRRAHAVQNGFGRPRASPRVTILVAPIEPKNSGARTRNGRGSIRTGIQGSDGGEAAASGERIG
jgi:hypothetical protein